MRGRDGRARLSESDGWSYAKGDKTTQDDALPKGFHSVAKPSWYGTVDIYCDTCNVSALTKQLP
jgi:hypothetical protein